MLLQRNLTFLDECLSNVAIGCPDELTVFERSSLRHHKPGDDDKNGWASAEPEERAPSVRGGIDESTRKDGSQEVSKCIPLLEHPRDDTSGFFGAILEGCSRCVSIEASHGNTEECSAGKELLVILSETSALQRSAARK
jgi:hypothetical protein